MNLCLGDAENDIKSRKLIIVPACTKIQAYYRMNFIH